jgi:hypothetical protein
MEDYYLLINKNFSNNQAYLKQLNETIYFDCVSNNNTLTYCRRNILFYFYGFNQTNKQFQKIGQMTLDNLNSDLNNLQQNVSFDIYSNQTFLIACQASTPRKLEIIFLLRI